MKGLASIKDLARFVQLQHVLATALTTKFGLEGTVTIGWPDRGEIEAEGLFWRFERHGLGYRFETERGRQRRTVIDFHEGLPAAWAVVDAWRIATYLGSIRSFPPLEGARSRPLLNVVDEWLKSEAEAGRLEALEKGLYRLTDQSALLG